METWVLFTFLAAFMQSVRTAGQKKLSASLSPMGTTLVRYLFGVPFALLYLVAISPDPAGSLRAAVNDESFLIYATLASVAQILATAALVKVLSLRNFAVGTIFSKTEAVQTAFLGMVFFGAALSVAGWAAVFLGAVGIIVLSFPKMGQALDKESMSYGVLSGLGFALTALWLRQASLSLNYSFIENAAITLTYTVILQTILCTAYIATRDRKQFSLIRKAIWLAVFVGATSAIGSIGWYTAMTYENAALVRSLGQVEIVFALLITYLFFGEKISRREFAGMAAILTSVLTLLLLV